MRFRFGNHAPVWGAVLSSALWLGFAGIAVQAQVETVGHRRFESCQPTPCYPCPPAPSQTAPPPTPGQAAPPSTGQQPAAPTPAAPQATAPQQPTEPSLGFERFAAVGGETVALSESSVGYIDSAIPRTQLRLRFDAAYDDNRPDRAEFFYAKCGCFRGLGLDAAGPPAHAPLVPEVKLDYQEFTSYFEVAFNERLSGFIEVPVRWVNFDVLPNTYGFGDLNAGFKYAVLYSKDQVVSVQLRTYTPTGQANRGLGTDHVSLEPSVLFFQRLSDRLTLEGEFRDWIPIGGSDFAGNIIRYGVGLTYDVYRSGKFHVAPVTELVGWTVLGGKELALAGASTAIQDASGDTIVNAKLGVRTSFENSSFYIGYGRALTGDVWYKDILRLEYRLTF
jgi:hypothetical protein